MIDAYPDSLAAVEYHVGSDGFDTPWGQLRFDDFYRASGGVIPVMVYDGQDFWDPGDYQYGFSQATQRPTDVTIELSATEVQAAVWTVHANVCMEPGGAGRTLRMYAVQTLDRYPSDPSYSRNTFVQAAPTEDVFLAAGSCSEFSTTFSFDSTSWGWRNYIKIIVWAQEPLFAWPAPVAQAAEMGWPFPAPPAPVVPQLPREFDLVVPLFDGPDSAWVADASSAEVLTENGAQVQATYQALCGDTTDLFPTNDPPTTSWPFPNINCDEDTYPIFDAGPGQQDVLLCDYDGTRRYPNQKWGVSTQGGPVTVPSTGGTVRPAGPEGLDSDGHLILFDGANDTAYDFWQATTVDSGECRSLGAGLTGNSIPQAGQVDFFDVTGDGANPNGVGSARASGTPLLAGLILPEDVESGEIAHALAVAIPGLRNLSSNPSEPLDSDSVYPASTTDTETYSVNPDALAAGQRLRMTSPLVDNFAEIVNEDSLAPITMMVIDALRNYGAYVVDNAPGFTFFAEDSHTADLELNDVEINLLIGRPGGTPLPTDRTKWQLVIETLAEELGEIPFAYGTCSGASSSVTTANFEVVDPAAGPAPPDPRTPRRSGGRRVPDAP
jgi:hypothetical protein